MALPYEQPLYEGPVYAGTLTYIGTVLKIEAVGQVSERDPSRVAGDAGPTHTSYTVFFSDFVPRSGEPKIRQCL